jgi:anti-anti-sigma regulatory factor
MQSGFIRVEEAENGSLSIICDGEWTLDRADRIEKILRTMKLPEKRHCTIDFEKVTEFDSAGMLLLMELEQRLGEHGCRTTRTGLNEKQKKILDLLSRSDLETPLPVRIESAC